MPREQPPPLPACGERSEFARSSRKFRVRGPFHESELRGESELGETPRPPPPPPPPQGGGGGGKSPPLRRWDGGGAGVAPPPPPPPPPPPRPGGQHAREEPRPRGRR